jgi:hypothetical protein
MVLGPWLFNVYLETTLKSNFELAKAIEKDLLVTFADDIFLTATSKE